MTLSVIVPQDWIAVSNEIEHRFEDCRTVGRSILEQNHTEWFLDLYGSDSAISVYSFDKTPKISTYLYAVCAGPYAMFEDSDPKYVKQRCFVRQSLKENLKSDLVMGITKTTLDVYEDAYGVKYPFSKIDHVMCPDFKFGAMENVGCITYGDGIMCSSKHMSIPQMTFFCVVI
jgi:aminopeptidase N